MVQIMSRKKVILLAVSLVFMASLLAGVVSAQAINDAFSKLADSFSGFKPGEYYKKAPYVFDAIFLFWLLLTIIYAVLAGKWEGRGGKVAVALSASITAATIILLNTQNKTLLGDAGPVILTVLALGAGLAAFKIFGGEHKSIAAGAILVLYFGITNAFPQTKEIMEKNSFVGAIVSLGLIIVFFVAFFGLFSSFRGSRDPAAVAETAGKFWPPRLWGGFKKGMDSEISRDESGVEVAEIRTEADLLNLLRDLERRFNDLVKGKKVQKDFIAIQNDMQKIVNDMGKLRKLEALEFRFENIKLRSGIGTKSKLRGMLEKENDLLKAFDSLVRNAFASVKTDLPQAKKDITEAKTVIRLLINLNKKERGDL